MFSPSFFLKKYIHFFEKQCKTLLLVFRTWVGQLNEFFLNFLLRTKVIVFLGGQWIQINLNVIFFNQNTVFQNNARCCEFSNIFCLIVFTFLKNFSFDSIDLAKVLWPRFNLLLSRNFGANFINLNTDLITKCPRVVREFFS